MPRMSYEDWLRLTTQGVDVEINVQASTMYTTGGTRPLKLLL
jgi:hypothetical protein